MELLFLGATKTVTGSKYLINFGGQNILLDCGLFQGLKELRLRNWAKFPVSIQNIDAIVLTHAHIDHTGYLPLLVKNGYNRAIYTTAGTKELCEILLPDSGHLQEEEANYANRHNYSKHHPALPLYTKEDALKVMKYMKVRPYNAPFTPLENIHTTFLPAGHIIGASMVKFQYKGKSLTFMGDLGRPNDLIMKPPVFLNETDFLVIESTYGNRLHEKTDPRDLLADIINKTIKKGGSLIIPAFAVGRAQSLSYYITSLKRDKRIPNIPVFLDSPMSINATNIFYNHPDEHRLSPLECNLMSEGITFTQTPQDSKNLDTDKISKIIISASGMATGGRVLHHIKYFAPDSRNTILFAGYQADGTRGDRMLKGEPTIKLLGEIIPVRAEVVNLTNVSAHADYEEMLDWLSHLKREPQKIFLTHGSEEAALHLKEKIHEKFGWRNCIIPSYMDREILK